VVAQAAGSAGEHAGSLVEPTLPLWLTVPASPGQLPGLRRALREWLAVAGVGAADAISVQVAVGEATTNAVEHSYLAAGEIGLVRLSARLDDDGVLFVQVADDGRWRPAEEHRGLRGRGFPLMLATMDEVDVRPSGIGTTVRLRLALGQQEPGPRLA
jgi:anti-sigma regulatory factor (Ser/Thr protein kinase)